MSLIKMQDLNLLNKRVMIRLDLNVPIKNSNIISDKRIVSSLPTIKKALNNGAKIILMSHLGRPIEGEYNKEFSLLPVVNYLKKYFDIPIRLVKDYLENDFSFSVDYNEIIVLENVRFNRGEISNNDYLSKKYSSLCDIFVMDAFATAHRAHSSTFGVIKYSPLVCVGPLFLSEIKTLSKAMSNPSRPMIAIVGGSKVSTKFNILSSLAKISDTIIVGGGIANTFIAIDNNVGKSLYEPHYIDLAKKLRDKYNIPVPIDCRVGNEFSEKSLSWVKNVDEINDNEEIMDLGDKTIKKLSSIILNAKTILWNGPVGVFEFPNFSKGTKCISEYIVNSNAFTIAGGGDTISAINLFKIEDKISYISTGGGAFLEFIEGKKLPSLDILEKKFKFMSH